MRKLRLIIDTILPGDLEMGLPSASSINFDIYLKKYILDELAFKFANLVEKVSMEKFGVIFSDIDDLKRLEVINLIRLHDRKFFSEFVTHLLRAYYTTPEVLIIIGTGSVPPFPQGNLLESDNWDLLEPVYERGKIYREAK